MAQRGRRNADEALALAVGAAVEQAAQKAGLSVRTAYRRRTDPAFVRRVRAARGNMAQRAGRVLTAAAMESVKPLLELQRPSSQASVRPGAARAVLEMGLRVRDAAELEARLAALEERLAAEEGDGGAGREPPAAPAGTAAPRRRANGTITNHREADPCARYAASNDWNAWRRQRPRTGRSRRGACVRCWRAGSGSTRPPSCC